MWGSPGYEPIQKLRQGRHREFPDTYLHARTSCGFFWSIHKNPSIETFGAGLSENEGFPSEMYVPVGWVLAERGGVGRCFRRLFLGLLSVVFS
jgi:hypothetical protein